MDQISPQTRFRQTATAKLARERLARYLQELDNDEGRWWRVQDLVPEAWATLEEDIWCEEEKIKLTIRLDASVVKFFRAMGKGYQARMNRVLATYAQMKIGEVERYRASMEEILETYGPNFPDEVGEAWRANRHLLPDDIDIDVERIDRWFGV